MVRQEPGAQRRPEPGPAAPRDRARGCRIQGRDAVDALRPLRRQLPLPDPRRSRARPAAAGRGLRQRARRPRRARRRLPTARRELLDGDAQQPRRHGPASGDRRPRQLRLHDVPGWSRAVAEHRGAPYRGPRRPDHGRRPGHRRARQRRLAGDPRGGRAALRPALLQAQGERQPARRHRPADEDRLGARRHRRPAPRHARRQRAVRRRRGCRRSLDGDGSRAGAPQALRGDALHRAADQAPGGALAQHRRARAPAPGDHRRVGRRAGFVPARPLARLWRRLVEGLQGLLQVARQPRALPHLERRGRRRLVLPFGRGPDDAGGPVRAAGPGARVAPRPGRRRAQRPPFHRRLRRPAAGRESTTAPMPRSQWTAPAP